MNNDYRKEPDYSGMEVVIGAPMQLKPINCAEKKSTRLTKMEESFKPFWEEINKNLKTVPAKVSHPPKPFSKKAVSISKGPKEKLKEIEHYYNCIQTIMVSGNGEAIATCRIRRTSVWNKHKLRFVTGEEKCQCIHCGVLLEFDQMTVEHMKPRVFGGDDNMDNLRPACERCNSTRPHIDMSEDFSCPPESFLILK